MAVNIHNLVAAINPDLYCDSSVKSKVEEILKETNDYLKAAEEAKPKEQVYMDLDNISSEKNMAKAPGIKAPIEKHVLTYDSFGESLEPIYFWILDMMSGQFKKVDKLVDNFVASPGSGNFSEMGLKATKMQEEAIKIMGIANQLVKSILNIIYDLKEFQMRLGIYDDFNSKDTKKSKPALLSLKQIWMDTVDAKKGNSSILMFARQFDYVTIIDAFMAAESPDAVNKTPEEGGLDLNERVRRILQQRISEFFRWITESEKELRKRFEIEKIYLKSQVSTAKIYSRWAKPYFKAAKDLEQRSSSKDPALVNAFNTALFELTLLGERKYDPEDDVSKGELPKLFLTAPQREYCPVLIVEFKFRTSPERGQQGGYGYRGKVEVTFTSYALNDEELKILRNEVEKDDLKDLMRLIEGATDDSLSKLSEDIEEMLGDKKKEEKKDEKKENSDENPFSVLVSSFGSLFTREKKEEAKKEGEIPKKDSDVEKILRSQAIISARNSCYKIYDIYKITHGMRSLPD